MSYLQIGDKLLRSLLMIVIVSLVVGCDSPAAPNESEVPQNLTEPSTESTTKTVIDLSKEISLPTDRRLSHSEAMGLAGDNFNYVDGASLEEINYLKQRAQDANEINVQYALATYQTWHHKEPAIETEGYQTIFKLAKLGQPHACADVYQWTRYTDEFFIEELKVNRREVVQLINDSCLEIALEYNANGIKYDFIEFIFFDYVNENNYSQLVPKLMQEIEPLRIARTKEYLLMYLSSWKNSFMNDIPDNNLADMTMISQYLQILAFDPYHFDKQEACAWLRYYDEDVMPYLKTHELPQANRLPEELELALPVLRAKLKNTEVDQQQCQARYVEIRDVKREDELFEKEFY